MALRLALSIPKHGRSAITLDIQLDKQAVLLQRADCCNRRELAALLSTRHRASQAHNAPFPSRFMGGNSTKATSGINGAGTQTQQELGIPDSAKLFFEDTKRSVSPHVLFPLYAP